MKQATRCTINYHHVPTFFVLIVAHNGISIFLSARAILKKQPRVLERQTLSASIVSIETLVITEVEIMTVHHDLYITIIYTD